MALEALSREVGYVRKTHGGRLRVALAFPNTYFVGMSNLGLQTVYRLFNADERVVCERVFLPGKQDLAAWRRRGSPLVTIESQTPVHDMDLFAFSVSFEWDYTNVLTLLKLAGLKPRAAARDPRDPLVVIGGAVTFVNPEPLAPFADVIAAGEAEILAPALVDAWSATDARPELLERLAATRGFYVPSFYDVTYAGPGRTAAIVPRPGTGAPAIVQKAAVKAAERLDPPQHDDLHPRHGVRVAAAHRSRARLCEPVPLLLGRLQLPPGTSVLSRTNPRIGRGGAAVREPRRPGVHCPVRPP